MCDLYTHATSQSKVFMVDRYLRVPKDIVLNSTAKHLSNIHPTSITLFAFGLGLIAVLSIAMGNYGWGLFFWLLNRFLDGLDGNVARLWGKQSDLGGYIDILLDFVIYALIPLSLVIADPSEIAYLSLGILLASFYVNAGSWMFLSAILEKRGFGKKEKASVTMPGGFIEGTETIIFYCFFLIFPNALMLLFNLMALLVLLTTLQRITWATKHL